MSSPIGICDSGVGGLSVLKKIWEKLPLEDTLYLADYANRPYSEKDRDFIRKNIYRIIKYFIKKEVKIIILACNTACTIAYKEVINSYKIPIFDAISPAAKTASEITMNYRIGVIGSRVTLEGKIHRKELEKINKNIKVFEQIDSQSHRNIVDFVQGDLKDKKILCKYLNRYLNPLKEKK